MNLKVFHIVFIVASVALCLGFGVWCLQVNAAEPDAGFFPLGVVGFGLAAGLLVYGAWFLWKLRRLG